MATLNTVPITFSNIFVIAKVNDVLNSSNVSIAKVLYVVRAPKKPTVKKAFSSFDGVYVINIAAKIPIRKLPTILTLSVAMDILAGYVLAIVIAT